MTTFYVLDGGKKKQGTAVNTEKATEVLNLMFPGQKAFIVDGDKVPFAQNMTIGEAETAVGIKTTVEEPIVQSIEVLPIETKIESKVVVNNTKPKKTRVKSKVVVKKPVKKKPVAKKKSVKKVVKKIAKKQTKKNAKKV